MYPKSNYHSREIDGYKFQKAKLTVKCKSKDNIFILFNTLHHITNNYNILLRSLKEITKEIGLYQITKDNCIGYENVCDTIATALHMKLSTGEYFNGLPSAQ